MSSRYTVEVIASGQPRAYADTVNHVRLTCEKRQEWRGSKEWEPDSGLKEEFVRDMLKALRAGFVEFTYPPTDREATMDDHFRTRLDWLKETAPGVWEFHTTSAFTD